MRLLVFPDYDADTAMWLAALRRLDETADITVAEHGEGTASPNTLDPAFSLARRLVAEPDAHYDAVVGIGSGGWSAHILALAGRADRLYVIDGLSGPFLAADDRAAARSAHLRARLFDNPTQPPRPHHDLAVAEDAAAAMPVPTTIVETPLSPLERHEVEALAARYQNGATVTEAADHTPAAVGRALGLTEAHDPHPPTRG